MKLYDYPTAPNCRRVRVYLAEKGIEVPLQSVDLIQAENLKPEFLAVNPFGVVPVLELDDGTRIGESMAICRYFEEVSPEPPLFGRTAIERAVVEMWSRRAETLGFASVADVFRNAVPVFAGRGVAGVTERVEQIPALIERGKAGVTRFFGHLDRRLAESENVAGSEFTVADITAMVTIDFAKFARLEVPAECENVKRWYARVSARPGAKA